MLALVFALAACTRTLAPPAPDPLTAVPESGRTPLPGLGCDVDVVTTEAGVPHVYAADDVDAARAIGFLYARDRFFFLDAARRLASGRLSGLLGDLALGGDVGARVDGMAAVAADLDARLDPRMGAMLQAYADGINTWIEVARAGQLPAPAEFELAYGLLGAAAPMDLAEPFTRADVAAVLTTIIYQLSFDPQDLARSDAAAALAAGLWPEGTPDLAAREALAGRLLTEARPLLRTASVAATAPTAGGPPPAPAPRLPRALLARAATAQGRAAARLGRPLDAPRGSNAWAVAGDHTTDGRALLAGDGHLPLSIPSLFWQLGVDTALRGGGDTHTLGLGLPGLPFIGVGTNGSVAWSLTRLRSDTTDWYAEELILRDGLPAASRFGGREEPLVATRQQVVVRGVPLFGSVARTETFTTWSTFDGRRLVDVEGELLDAPDDRPYVRTTDGVVVPGDLDGDGVVSGISFDWAGLDPIGLLTAFDAFGHAADVGELAEATAWLNGYAQNTVAADAAGDVFYTAYGAVPCRDTLRDPAGGWQPGGDPLFVLDGARFGGFTIPVGDDLRVGDGADGSACSIPRAEQPSVTSPPQGYVQNANQDPAGLSFDGDLSDGVYLGGPWDVGQRGRRIDERLQALVADGAADVAAMAALQGDHETAWARLLLPALLQAAADAAADGAGDEHARLSAAWDADPRLGPAVDQLAAWAARGHVARSGVDTPWHAVDAAEIDDSSATMLFHAWLGRFVGRVFDDEGIPDALWSPSRSDGTMRLLVDMVRADTPALDADPWLLPGAEVAVLADDLATEDVTEGWRELALLSLTAALDHLASPPTGAGEGGFGSADPTAWRWGLRHQVLLQSVLTDFLGDDPLLSALTSSLAITPAVLPMGGELDRLPGFPRGGADDSVDQAGAGFETDHWRYTHGPVFRMVLALGPGGVSGLNVLPGGQSALPDDPHFADQARLWLANEALPIRFTVAEVVEGATGRLVLEADRVCP